MRQLQLDGVFYDSTGIKKSPEKVEKKQPQQDGCTTLWLCIYLPDLALEVFKSPIKKNRPEVVVEETAGRMTIAAASTAAREQGVQPGMSLSAACALCRALNIHHRDLHAEQEKLEQLADWAGQFTSRVSLEPPQALLLEIGASLKLFGGVDSLWQRLSGSLSSLVDSFNHAITPAPLASLWLARCNRPLVITCPDELRSALGKLPLRALGLEPRLEKRLHNTGVRVLHDLWRLPRDGLARRFGANLLDTLDRALGRSSDLRHNHNAPLHFEAALELPMETRNSRFIMSAAERLLAQLIGFLQHHDAAVNAVQFGLLSNEHPPHWLTIGLRQGSRDATRLLNLLEQHLNPLRLAAPINTLCLESMAIQPFSAVTQPLFRSHDTPQYRESEWHELIERLQNRLGVEAVFTLQSHPDHRPELAWSRTEPGVPARSPVCSAPRRPLWLLPEPRPLLSRDTLTLRSGPERIESGWWSNTSIRRDYYTARSHNGQGLWIFHDLTQPGQWYLHGLFG